VIPKLRSLAEGMGLAIHSITTRSTRGEYHIEAHIAMEGTLPLGTAHAMASQLEVEAKRQIDRLAEIVTHIEPTEDQDTVPGSRLSADGIAQAICDLVIQTYGPERCHDVQVYPMGDSWAASLHVLLDESTPLAEAHIASSQIEVRLRDIIPRLSHVIVHTEPLSIVEGSA
jgi:divalent metal cation (Fe/Co/Zn/Cd) transporter